MRRISIAIALTVFLLASFSSAQQTAPNAFITSQPSGSPTTAPGSIIGGDGTTNYVPIWAKPDYLLSSVIYQSSAGNVGVGSTTPEAKVDVSGSVNATVNYQLDESTVLSIGSTADDNLFVGVGAGANDLPGQGYYNTFSGYNAGYSNTSGIANTFSGIYAGLSNTTGGQNTFLGASAGSSNTTGSYNTFTGAQAGLSNTTAGGNTFTADSAGTNNTTGFENTFTGSLAGRSNSTGSANTFTGSNGYYNTTGSNNTFTGQGAGFLNSTGGDNIFEGAGAAQNNTTGSYNTVIGTYAGQYNATASSNIFVGYVAGYYNTTGNNDIYVGNKGPSSGTESSTIRIGGDIGQGNGPQTATYIVGIYGVNAGGIPVEINANGQLGAPTSSLRFKEQVRDMGDSTSALMKLRPVTFFYKPKYADGERTRQYGLIAEEVAKLYPELVAYDNEGQPYSVRYQYLSTMLLNEVQKQYRRAEAEAEVITSQEQKINDLEQRLSRLEALVGTRVNGAQIDAARHTISGAQ